MWSFLLGPSSPCDYKSRVSRALLRSRASREKLSLKAFPTMESRRRIAHRVRDMPDHGSLDLKWPLVESVEGAEEKPVGPLTQHQHDLILSNLANLSLRGKAAGKVHVVTRQQQRQNEAKLSNDDNDKCESSEKKKEVAKVVKEVVKDECPWIVENRQSHDDESHDEWKEEQEITHAALDEYKERLKRTRIDDEQEKGEVCKKEKLEEQHQLDIEEETDEKFFRRVRRERESTPLTTGTRLKIPRNRYVDTGLPADVKKAEKHMHEMLGTSDGKLSSRGWHKCNGVKGW